MRFFKPNVVQLEKKKDLSSLIVALQDKDDVVRRDAAGALGRIGDISAVEPLLVALQDGWVVAQVAARALGMIGDSRAVEPLISALQRDMVGDASADALKEISDAHTADLLLAALSSPDTNTSHGGEIAKTLDRIGWKSDNDKNAELYWNAKVKPLLYNMSQHQNRGSYRRSDLDELVRIGPPAIVPLLTFIDTYLYSEEAAEALTNILAGMENAHAISALVSSLNSSKSDGRLEVAKRLKEKKWEPSKDENGAYYWLAFGEMKQCIEIGVPATEPVLEYLFKYPACFQHSDHLFNSDTRLNHVYKHYKPYGENIPDYIATYTKMFGDYTELVLKAAGYFSVQHLPECYIYPLEESETIVNKLCNIVSPVSNNLLHRITKKENIKVVVFKSTDGIGDHNYKILDFEPLRKVAQIELVNRGNPKYDPSVYLSKDAWKL